MIMSLRQGAAAEASLHDIKKEKTTLFSNQEKVPTAKTVETFYYIASSEISFMLTDGTVIE